MPSTQLASDGDVEGETLGLVVGDTEGDSVGDTDGIALGDCDGLREGGLVGVLEGDVLDADVVARAMAGVEVVFHQAALASVPRSVANPLETNAACVTGTLTVLEHARKKGVRRVVYAASSSAYGDQDHPCKTETDLPSPISPYAVAKLAAEYYCQSYYTTYGFETVCLRYFNVFGPRQDPDSPYSAVIPLFICAMLSGERPVIFGDGPGTRLYLRLRCGAGESAGS